MNLLIEDLARERMREIQRDSEWAWQVKQARVARRAAKARGTCPALTEHGGARGIIPDRRNPRDSG